MEQKNEMMITFDSRSSNESFARVAVAAFTTQLNPTRNRISAGNGRRRLCRTWTLF